MNSLQQIGTLEMIKKFNWNETIQLFEQASNYLIDKIDNIKKDIYENNKVKLEQYKADATLAREQIKNANNDYDLQELWWKRLEDREEKINKIIDNENEIKEQDLKKDTKKYEVVEKVGIGLGIGAVALSLVGIAVDLYNKLKK